MNAKDKHICIKKRAECKKLGLNKYYTGEPCIRGHIAERYVSTGLCVQCIKEPNDHVIVRVPKRHVSFIKSILAALEIDDSV